MNGFRVSFTSFIHRAFATLHPSLSFFKGDWFRVIALTPLANYHQEGKRFCSICNLATSSLSSRWRIKIYRKNKQAT